MTRCVAILVAAGTGTRASLDIPKQFSLLAGKPVLSWSAEAFEAHEAIDRIVIVTSREFSDLAREALSHLKKTSFVIGGAERTDSVRNALAALESDPPERVLIHDAARPGLSSGIIDALLDKLLTHDAAAPALMVADALKRLDGSKVSSVSRDGLYRCQTPQAFRYGSLVEAHAVNAATLPDDLEAVERLGGRIALTAGDHRLMKLTFKEDFEMVERLLFSSETRIGSGFDVHAFEPGNHVTLCGVKVDHDMALKGHSDADVAWHALTDAILGAISQGDIGDHFPPTDAQWSGEPSSTFLKHACDLAANAGYRIVNVDLTIICEAPKIKPRRDDMRRSTAELLNLDDMQVSVKATTTEALGFTGRREGIAAQASVSLMRMAFRGGQN